jgi:hypothetical protein
MNLKMTTSDIGRITRGISRIEIPRGRWNIVESTSLPEINFSNSSDVLR